MVSGSEDKRQAYEGLSKSHRLREDAAAACFIVSRVAVEKQLACPIEKRRIVGSGTKFQPRVQH
jgi:hypothetical protein